MLVILETAMTAEQTIALQKLYQQEGKTCDSTMHGKMNPAVYRDN